jgi:hypothetical protein
MKGRHYSEDLSVDGMIILKGLRERLFRAWIGLT